MNARYAALAVALILAAPGSRGNAQDPAAATEAAESPARADYGYCLQQGKAIYQKTRNGYRAVAWFRRAVQIQPDGHQAIRAAGISEAVAENDDEALVYLGEAVRLDPADIVGWYWLGVVQRRQGRKEGAYAALERAARGTDVPAGFAWIPPEAAKAVESLRAEDAALPERAAAKEKSPGPAAVLLVRYWGASPRDANMRDPQSARMLQPASLDTGAALEPRLLRAVAFDAAGFRVSCTPLWSVSAGLRLESGPADSVPRIFAGATPATAEEIVARDSATGLEARARLAVLGPAVALAVLSSQPEIGPGQRAHLETKITDAAGNLLYHRLTRWGAASAAGPADPLLVRAESLVTEENNFEPHRNMFVLPEQAEPRPATYAIHCLEPETGVRGSVNVTGLAEPAAIGHGGHGPLPWLEDLERAREVAARDHRMILADFSAEW